MTYKFSFELYGGMFAVATTVKEYEELMRDFAGFTDAETEDALKDIDEGFVLSSMPGFNKGRDDRHVVLIYSANVLDEEVLIVPTLQLAMKEYIRTFPEQKIQLDVVGRLQKQIFRKLKYAVLSDILEKRPVAPAAENEGGDEGKAEED